jgi:threonine dehydrogenase-like Zn-dependent dehydrogenase
MVGSNAFGVEEWKGKRQHAMRHYFDLIREHAIDVTPIITHRFALADYKQAFLYNHRQGDHRSVKVLFDFTQ